MPFLIIVEVLRGMGMNRPQQKFLAQLFSRWLGVRGRFNVMNLSRYVDFDERTLRRWFARDFEWADFNRRFLMRWLPAHHELIAALDASFIPKSGKGTFGLGYFFNGCLGRSQKGLEVSLVSVMDVTQNTAYSLSVCQTPPGEVAGREKDKGKGGAVEETRIDAYLAHFTAVRVFLLPGIRHLAVDGYFTNYKFVQGVCDLQMEIVGKLRRDANLRYLYTGPQNKRGRPRKYAGKVVWSNLDWRRWKKEGEVEAGVLLYSASLYHVSLKRVIRVVLLQDTRKGKPHMALLFSTDLQLSARDIVRYYKARFQIEFLFREAKQNSGLNDCQARNEQTLQFHWNAALSAVNLAKWQEAQRSERSDRAMQRSPHTPFSLASCKLRHSNEHLLQLFSHRLGLDWRWIKSHPAYSELCNYGAIRS